MYLQIKRAAFALFLSLFCFVAYAQKTVTGNVKDASGDPMIGITVSLDGKPVAVTDLDGNFTVQNAKSSSVIKLSYVGYLDQQFTVGNKNQFNLTMKEDPKALEEVVVVGYGTMKRSDLTGAVTSVGDEAISKSVSTSIDQVLQGRAAGVQVQANTGTPGGSSTIRIRGTNSLNATSQPIFVIDGVIIDSSSGDNGDSNPLSEINPSDIVSMDILKDASATAIYGSRASNGVIMITTKRGKAGDATVTYDGYVGWQTMPKSLDVLNLKQYAQHYNDIADAQIKSATNSFVRPELLGEGTYWQDELFRHALMTSHNLSVTGGSEKITYALSAGYLDQDGIVIGSSFRRQTLRGNTDAQIKKWLKGGFSFSLADSKQQTLANSYSIVLYMYMTALDDPTRVIAQPGGYFLVPQNGEYIGDVMNVVFSNGWIADEDGKVFIYYASSDTRMHVATSTIDRLVDYCMHTPQDGYATGKSVETIKKLIEKNKKI